LSANRSVIGDRHRLAIERQALTTAGDNLQRALRVPAIRLLDVQPLFGLGNFRALAIDRLQRRSVLLLGQRQAFLPRFEAQLPLFDRSSATSQQTLPALVVGRQLPGLCLPMRPVVGQLGEPRLVLAARFPPVANLGFQPCNLGIGRKEVTLRRMHAVAGGKMSFARLLETSLEITQGAFRASRSVAACSISRVSRSRSDCASLRRSSQSNCCLRVSSSLYSRYWRATLA
jgi:hypothetical protein